MGKHDRANRGRVLQRMAWNFRITMKRHDRRAKITNLDWSKDLFLKGYASLDKAVEGFNGKFTYDAAEDDRLIYGRAMILRLLQATWSMQTSASTWKSFLALERN